MSNIMRCADGSTEEVSDEELEAAGYFYDRVVKKKEKHTPGPWKATADETVQGYPSYRIDSPTVSILASLVFETKEDRDSFGAANAKLIAAAPDLLEALQAIRARINGEWNHLALVKFGGLTTVTEDCLQIADAAIKKGETE